MRFGRKSKHRLRVGTIVNGESSDAHPPVGTVASEERNALLDSGASHPDPSAHAGYSGTESGDPTQLLLTCLGGFQRQLAASETGAGTELWCDESMNCLISGVEVAIREGWSDVVEALTESGRILQTYENAGRAKDCIPFLNDAYEILCLMTGDLIVDDVRPGVREKWRSRYERMLGELEAAGLTLVQDEENDAETGSEAGPLASKSDSSIEVPFEFPPNSDSKSSEVSESVDFGTMAQNNLPEVRIESPVADRTDAFELSPEATPFNEIADTESGNDSEEPEAPKAALPESKSAGPPRIVVDVLDRLCEQFTGLEKAAQEDQAYYLERIEGGLKTLLREAEKKEGHPAAQQLCTAMQEIFQMAGKRGAYSNEGLLDLGFSFCAVYNDALEDGDRKTISDWIGDRQRLADAWENSPPAPPKTPASSSATDGATDADDPSGESLMEEEERSAETSNEAGETSDLQADPPKDAVDDSSLPSLDEYRQIDEAAVETDEEARVEEPPPMVTEKVIEETGVDEAPVKESAIEEPPIEETAVDADPEPGDEPAPTAGPEDAASEAVTEPVAARGGDEGLSSTELLESAQRAAARGDGEAAKYFALQAAAQIAREESEKADRQLQDDERKLKESMESAEDARAAVAAAEEGVLAAASDVSKNETALGAAEDHTAGIAQKLEDSETDSSEIAERLTRLQEELDAKKSAIGDVKEELDEARVDETKAEERLALDRKTEDDERTKLETCRQDVKDLLSANRELEGQVEAARSALERQKQGLIDIEGTVKQTYGEDALEQESGEMLF